VAYLACCTLPLTGPCFHVHLFVKVTICNRPEHVIKFNQVWM
jgi:hypothetical protein